MLRVFAFSLFAIAIAGCDNNPTDALSDTLVAETLIDQIKAGSPKGCSAEEIKKAAIDLLTPDYEPSGNLLREDIEVGLSKVNARLEAITLNSVERSVGGVSCDANLVVASPGSSTHKFGISYIVRPSAESETEFVVRGDFGDVATAVATLTAASISAARDDRLRAASASEIDVNSSAEEEEETYIENDDLDAIGTDTNQPTDTEEPANTM